MRQFYKHVIGCETTSSDSTKDHAWNEISGRYKPVTEYYVPSNWREQSKDNKQASCGSCAPEIQEKATQAFSEVGRHPLKPFSTSLNYAMNLFRNGKSENTLSLFEEFWKQKLLNYLYLRFGLLLNN